MNILKKIPFIAIVFFVIISQVRSVTDDRKCISSGGKCQNPKTCNGAILSNLCPGGADNKCCIPKPVGTSSNNSSSNNTDKCASKGGKCQNPNTCNGTILSNLCPGGANNKCCIPKPNGTSNNGSTSNTDKCASKGGKCQNPNTCNGTILSNLCPGGANNKCCISKPGGTSNNGSNNSDKCASRGGKCMNPNNCNGSIISNLCPGGANNKCCISKPGGTSNNGSSNNSDKCASQGGQCMNPSKCNGSIIPNLCPGGANNKCCVKNPPSTNTPSTNTPSTNTPSTNPPPTSSVTVSYSLEEKIRIIYETIKSNIPDATHNGIAAILGNFDVESGIEPKRAEADYVKPPVGADSKSSGCWDDIEWLSIDGPRIYNGNNKKIIHRGLGLGMWTDTTDGSIRHTLLLDYANSKGKKWYDLSLQLDFMLNGDSANYIKNLKNVLTSNEDVSVLTKRFLNNWEGNPGDKLSQRQARAAEMLTYLNQHF